MLNTGHIRVPAAVHGRLPALRVLALLCAGLLSAAASALDLGQLQVQSVPGQPFKAVIELHLLDSEPAGQMIIDKGSRELYARRGIDYHPYLDSLNIGQTLSGAHTIQINLSGAPLPSHLAPKVLLTVQWPQGMQEQRFSLGHAPTSEAQASAVPQTVAVQASETLDTIAKRLSQVLGVNYLHIMYALYQANPEAFYRNNMNNLKAGVTLKVPPLESVQALDDASVYQAIRAQYAEWQAARSGNQPTEAGAMLSAMPDEFLSQPLAQDTDPEQLQARLRALASYNSAMADDNRQMSKRLSQLEQQVAVMTKQLLPEEEGAGAIAAAAEPDQAPPAPVESTQQGPAGVTEPTPAPVEQNNRPLGATLSLPPAGLIGVLVLAVLGMLLVWRRRSGALA